MYFREVSDIDGKEGNTRRWEALTRRAQMYLREGVDADRKERC